MLRRRHFLQVMHRFALMGALLMAVAPVVSRWVQFSQQGDPGVLLGALCTGQGLQLVDLETMAVAKTQAGHTLPTALGRAGLDGGDLPGDHAEMACDYCLLAAQLLLFVVALLSLPLLRVARLSPAPGRTPVPVCTIWPAHAARGPPVLSVI